MKQATANCPAKVSRSKKFDVRKLELVPILKRGEAPVSVKEAVHRGRENPATNWGKREMEQIWAVRESIPISVWRVGKYVLFTKRVWRRRYGHRYVWCVDRDASGWSRGCCWLGGDVDAGGMLPSLRK
ncbi:MAG: hypothetical protein Q7R85_04325 [bacterium]|nr:hypothetical protein [bacterium]